MESSEASNSSHLCTTEELRLSDINASIALLEKMISRIPPGHIYLPIALSDMASTLVERFRLNHQLSDLSKAISASQKCVDLCPPDHADFPSCLQQLGFLYMQRYHHTGNLPDLSKAIETGRRAVELVPPNHPEMLVLINDLGISLSERVERTSDPSDIAEGVKAFQRAIDLLPPDDNGASDTLIRLGALISRYNFTDEIPNLERTIDVYRQAVQLPKPSHLVDSVDIPCCWGILGHLLVNRFHHSNVPSDIDEGIASYQRAIELISPGDEDTFIMLSRLGDALLYRFEQSKNPEDITKVIATCQKAVALPPSNHSQPLQLLHCFSTLGVAFIQRFQQTKEPSDATDAIAANERALQLSPANHAGTSNLLAHLGHSYTSLYQHRHSIHDLSKAISAYKQATQISTPGDSKFIVYLRFLGDSLFDRFEHSRNIPDVDEAIEAYQKAVDLTPPGHESLAARLSNVGKSCTTRFQHTGNLSDVDRGIEAYQKSVELASPGHERLPLWLKSLASALVSRFECRSDLSDIIAAIAAAQNALHITAHGDVIGRSTVLSTLGRSFSARFRHTGNLLDNAEAIAMDQRAVELTPTGNVNLSHHLNRFGHSLVDRFFRTQDLVDIDKAVATHQAAVDLTDPGQVQLRSRLSGLGSSLLARFHFTQSMVDISAAITAHQRAADLTPPDHEDHLKSFTNLGNAYKALCDHTKDLSYIDKSIEAHREAVKQCSTDRPGLQGLLNNLGISLLSRFNMTGTIPDIDESISMHQRAVGLVPADHPNTNTPLSLSNLGNSYFARFSKTGSMDNFEISMESYRAATTCPIGPPSQKLKAARSWATMAHGRMLRQELLSNSNPGDSLAETILAFDTAIQLLTLVAGVEQTIEQRHRQLKSISDLSLEAAAVGCAIGRLDKAVEWLEQGRCLVWRQMNQLRTPLEELAVHDKSLAERVSQVSNALEKASSRERASTGGVRGAISVEEGVFPEEEALAHVRLAKEWDGLLGTVRSTPGFDAFLRPAPCSTLLNHLPATGMVVVINVHETRCDAFALRSGLDPLHIPLPDFTHKKAELYFQRLNKHLRSAKLRMSDGTSETIEGVNDQPVDRAGALWYPKKERLEGVLARLWGEVVKPILTALEIMPSQTIPQTRVWWCPTGPLTFLPLHAAGIYTPSPDQPSESAFDYVVSSYTPNISVLTGRVKENGTLDRDQLGLFLMSQPNVPGQSIIPGTTTEVELLENIAKEHAVRVKRLEGKDATKYLGLKNMEESSVIHFACHAIQDVEEPLKSGFFFHDGRLELSEITQSNLKNADLAFLSACQTSTGDANLSEEAVHLAAGMLAVGYRGVVATMWSISDEDAPGVAQDFYEYLWANQNAEDGRIQNAAAALHHAVKQLMKTRVDSFHNWIPYVHFGV